MVVNVNCGQGLHTKATNNDDSTVVFLSTLDQPLIFWPRK